MCSTIENLDLVVLLTFMKQLNQSKTETGHPSLIIESQPNLTNFGGIFK
jgi:hypothetical protein